MSNKQENIKETEEKNKIEYTEDQFTLEVLITEASIKALEDGIVAKNILEVTKNLAKYTQCLKSDDLKQKYSYMACDLAIYGCETNKRYNQEKCKPILEELSKLVIPTATIQF